MHLLPFFKHFASQVLQPECVFCGQKRLAAYPLCQPCYTELPWLAAEYNYPLADCDDCISAFAYYAPIRQLLLGVKFGKHLRTLQLLGELTAVGILPQISAVPEAILPIPLHSRRLQQRGFNQALELARPLAQQLGIPLLSRAVTRQKSTQRQTELTAEQRQENMHQAFQLTTALPYKHLAIFDDVITTGATCRELARTLRANGVQTIQVWSCARPILRQKCELDKHIDYY